MVSPEQAEACLDAATAEPKAMSYEELETFAELHDMFDQWQTRRIDVGGVAVEVSVLAGKLGWLRNRKRITMETCLGSVDNEFAEGVHFDYFERYQSGRFYPSPDDDGVLGIIVKDFLALIAVSGVLAALGCYLFMRSS